LEAETAEWDTRVGLKRVVERRVVAEEKQRLVAGTAWFVAEIDQSLRES